MLRLHSSLLSRSALPRRPHHLLLSLTMLVPVTGPHTPPVLNASRSGTGSDDILRHPAPSLLDSVIALHHLRSLPLLHSPFDCRCNSNTFILPSLPSHSMFSLCSRLCYGHIRPAFRSGLTLLGDLSCFKWLFLLVVEACSSLFFQRCNVVSLSI